VKQQQKTQKKVQPQILNEVLRSVANFIQSLEIEGDMLSSIHFDFDVFFSTGQDQALYLDVEDSRQYRECLKRLRDTVTVTEQITPKTVEKLFQQAILDVLDLHHRRSELSREQRLKEAIETLKTEFTSEPHIFQVYYPVAGLALEGLPKKVGRVEFCIFNETHISRFRDLLDRQQLSPKNKQDSLELLDEMTKNLLGNSAAMIEVAALDDGAARSLALRTLRLTLDIINFFSDIVPYSYGHVYLPGDAEGTVVDIPCLLQDGKSPFYLSRQKVGPLLDFSLQKLFDADVSHNLGLSNISNILVKNRSKLEERLLAAMQWAGRATVNRRKEESFLLYAIALESIVLVEEDNKDLAYRLRTRVAHLMADDFESRLQISEDVKELYNTRSSIVHNGQYQVTDASLSRIRFLAKNCIVHLLRDEPFASMDKPDDLTAWFNLQILS
jgi:hypothetical protein